jgi:hypothetical protein
LSVPQVIWKRWIMKDLFRPLIELALPGIILVIVLSPGVALAQGSMGGSIGNNEKSLSGAAPERSVERERPARRSRQDEARPARRSGGGGGSFDGAWVVIANGVTCSGSSSNAVVVTSGRIIGNHVSSGSVSPSGAVRATGGSNGLTNVTTGRLSGRTGSGTFVQSDGCRGTWTAAKQ